MTSSGLEILAGVVLDGKYRVDRLLGSGGMGAVYRGEHVATGRPVAVKTLLPRFAGDFEIFERFKREARAAGQLRHPNIVDVTDFGIAEINGCEVPYLVMELVDGDTLRALLQRHGRLTPETFADILEQIAIALDTAHDAGVIHRDLKPENICLVPNPRGGYFVRILDFGIASLSGFEGEGNVLSPARPSDQSPALDGENLGETIARVGTPRTETDDETAVRGHQPRFNRSRLPASTPSLTVEGSTLGTIGYMSPEQCRGNHVDRRTDIYSLGVIAWETLAGRRLYQGSLSDVMNQQAVEATRLDDERAGISEDLADVVAKAIASERSDRFESAGAFAGSFRVAISPPSVILRRSISILMEHFPTLLAISFRASLPALLLTAVVLTIAAPIWSPIGVVIAVPSAFLIWAVAVVRTNAALAIAVDQLRHRPFEPVDAQEVFRTLRTRVGLRADQGELELFFGIAKFGLLADHHAPSTMGDLALIICLLEKADPRAIRERCRKLGTRVGRAYSWIGIIGFTLLIVGPLIDAAILYGITALVRHPSVDVAIFGAVALVPLNATLFNPVLSIALTLLYFRARQASGETVETSGLHPRPV